ncbi:MAG: leucine-rich repeat domain-containing protein, partial [Leadbetterella sp.]|nr:leucine-rich repeat domain-containing protein [Leadbetterella sp.]
AYAKTYPIEHLAFVYAGADTIRIIAGIPDKNNTILFLDGLDEDHDARHELSVTLDRLSRLMREFKKIIVSSRIQFFTDQIEEWTGLGGNLKLEQVHLSTFSRKEAEYYLKKKFAGQKDLLAKATLIFNASSNFFCRPLLLSWFDLLLYNDKAQYHYLFEVFETIVHEWTKREAAIVEPDNFQGKHYPAKLLEFSKKLTLFMYKQQKGILAADEFETIITLGKNLGINQRDAQSRSFLTRNRQEDSWAFSHKSFFDYFLAILLFEQEIREENFEFTEYPESERFFNEMCWKKCAGQDNPPLENGVLIDLGNDVQMQRLKPNSKISAIPNRALRAWMTRIPSDKWDAYPQKAGLITCWENFIAFLKPLLQEKSAQTHYIFQDYCDYEKAINGEYVENIRTRFYLHCFLAEFVYWKYNTFINHVQTEMGNESNEEFLKKYLKDYDFNHSFQDNLPGPIKGLDLLDIFIFSLSQNEDLRRFVTKLHLSNLNITDSEPLHPVFELPQLRSLDLSNNHFENVECLYPMLQLPQLRILDLSNNQIKNIESLRPVLELQGLKELYLYNNPLDPKLVGTDRSFNCLNLLRSNLPPIMVLVEGGVFKMGRPYSKKNKKLTKQRKQ